MVVVVVVGQVSEHRTLGDNLSGFLLRLHKLTINHVINR